jgi:hypothetical protein
VTVATSRGEADPSLTSRAGAARRQAVVSPYDEGESKVDAERTPRRKIGPARSIGRHGSISVLHAEVGGVTGVRPWNFYFWWQADGGWQTDGVDHGGGGGDGKTTLKLHSKPGGVVRDGDGRGVPAPRLRCSDAGEFCVANFLGKRGR